MNAQLFALLRCPETGEPLREEGDALVTDDGRRYPVVSGVPRFVPSDDYADNFGRQWNKFRRTQLDNEPMGMSEQSFRRITGWTPEMLAGKTVLDVGCGMGRYLEVAARWGANVVGFDLSSAVNAAEEHLGAKDNVEILQASLLEPPFAPGSFDFVYSIGVLHHTPDTHQAVRSIARLVKPGGRLAIWVYDAYNPLKDATSKFWRRFTTKLSWPLLLWWSRLLIWSPLYWLGRYRPFRLMAWIIPVSCEPQYEARLLDTVDWYGPAYQWKHRYPEVYGWFEDLGFEDIVPREPAVAVGGRRPAAAGAAAAVETGTVEAATATEA